MLDMFDVYFEPYQTSVMNLFCENSRSQFFKGGPSQTFDWVLHAPLDLIDLFNYMSVYLKFFHKADVYLIKFLF